MSLKYLLILLCLSAFHLSPSHAAGETTVVGCNLAAWQQAEKHDARIVETTDGKLTLHGANFTNAKLVNGRYDGNRIVSISTFNLEWADVFYKFVADGADSYQSMTLAAENIPSPRMSTHHSFADSVLVEKQTPYFVHISLQNNGIIKWTLSKNAYATESGSEVVASKRIPLMLDQQEKLKVTRLVVGFGDNYAGREASMTLLEAKVIQMRPSGGSFTILE